MKYYTEYIYKQSFVCLLYFYWGEGGWGSTEMVDGVAITIATPPMLNN